MIRKAKKTRKRRGYRTHGYGRIGQHRNKGQQGGFGKTGLEKGKKIWRIKYAPDAIGKHGFKRPQSLHNEIIAINVGILDQIVENLTSNGKATKSSKGFSIDLSKLGITKLLGSGKVTKSLEITVASASDKAKTKIEAAGGKILPVNN